MKSQEIPGLSNQINKTKNINYVTCFARQLLRFVEKEKLKKKTFYYKN